MSLLLSLGGIYLFIVLGYAAKKSFGERIDEKTLVLFSIYFLQPILVFWGLTTKPIDETVIQAPLIFILCIGISLVVSFILALLFFKHQQDRSIVTVASIVGNTGNLGIPLGLALFGEPSIIYTSIINLANVFLVYTVGVFFYARSNFSIKEAIQKIFELPVIWFGFAALLFNYWELSVPNELVVPLEMGAYATLVVQLSIFGMYLSHVKANTIDWKLFGVVGTVKFVLIPIVSIFVLSQFDLPILLYNVILLELLVPLAVMNVNLASLYSCKPTQVAFLIFATSVLFLFYLLFAKEVLFH